MDLCKIVKKRGETTLRINFFSTNFRYCKPIISICSSFWSVNIL